MAEKGKAGRNEGGPAALAAALGADEAEVLEVLAPAGLGMSPADWRRAEELVLRESGWEELTLELAGRPLSAKRPRAVIRHVGDRAVAGVHSGDSEDQAAAAHEMALQIPRGFVPCEGEVELWIDVYVPTPASWPKYKKALAELGHVRPCSAPDYDNYAKILTDALRMRAFRDDAQVTTGTVRKFYSARPRTTAHLRMRRRRLA